MAKIEKKLFASDYNLCAGCQKIKDMWETLGLYDIKKRFSLTADPSKCSQAYVGFVFNGSHWFISFISAAKFNSAFQHFENFVRCFGRSVVPLIPLHAELHASEYVCFWHHWICWIFTSIWWSDSLIESNTPDWRNIPLDYLTAECFFNSYSVKTYKISNTLLTSWFRCCFDDEYTCNYT